MLGGVNDEKPSTEWIAARRIQARWPDGREGSIVVEIGVPYSNDPEEEFWYTTYRISGIDDAERTEIFGVDPLSSLVDAIVTAGMRLRALAERGIELSWLGGPDLGFPDPVRIEPPG